MFSGVDNWAEFTDWMDKWQGYHPQTSKMYLRMIKRFFDWMRENELDPCPATISAGLVRDYRTYLAEIRHRKPGTINKNLQVIRIYCRWALSEGLIKTNSALRVQYVEEPILAPKSMSNTEFELLRNVISDKKLKTKTMIEVGLSAGLRVAEAANLKIGDLRLKKRNGEIYVRHGKGFKYRTVPIAPDLVQLLREYISQLPPKQEYLFVNERYGRKISTRGIQKVVERLREETGFDFTFHTLRHTFCTDLLNSGMKLTDVAIVAGHLKKNGSPNIATTARYVLSRQDELIRAVKKMANWRIKRTGNPKESE